MLFKATTTTISSVQHLFFTTWTNITKVIRNSLTAIFNN